MKKQIVSLISLSIVLSSAALQAQQKRDSLKEKTIEEVVVIGYGTQKKSLSTGAISSVKSKEIEKLPAGRVETVLQGRTSGVTIAANNGQPGTASTVRVRGITTFNNDKGGNDPLWIVDGVMLDNGALGMINQADIESVEVLKDAASAAIYGTRAARGVILVTTKKGRSGKLNVNFDTSYGISSVYKKLNLLNASQYAALINEMEINDGRDPKFSNIDYGKGTDWQSVIFKPAAKQSHNISLSGGSDKATVFASFGYLDQAGIVMPEISTYRKMNARINTTFKVSDLLKVGENFSYAHTKAQGIGNTNSEFGGPLSSALNLDPITPAVVTDPTVMYPEYAVKDDLGRYYGISSNVTNEMSNPLAYAKTQAGNYGYADDFLANVYAELQPVKDLVFKTTLGGKLSYWGGEYFSPKFYFNSSNSSTVNNKLSKESAKGLSWSIENTLTYNKRISDHNFTLLLGQGYYVDNISNLIGFEMRNLPVNTHAEASFNFPYTTETSDGWQWQATEHKTTSLFGRLIYDYQQKYLFTGIVRRDGSTRFGTNNKYGNFPSLQLGWVVSKENFFENNLVDFLKLKYSYGVTGNDAIRDFGFLALVQGGRNYFIGNTIVSGYVPTSLENPDLHWEETAQTDFGLESRFLKNKFNFSADYFIKKTSGILQEVNIPGYVGVDAKPVGNVADMENRGYEFELGYKDIIGELSISATSNFSIIKNKITNLGVDVQYIEQEAANIHSMGNISRTEIGHSYNEFYGFQYSGVFQNYAEINAYKNSDGGLILPNAKPGDFIWKDLNGDGRISDADKTYLGKSLPKYTFGLTANLQYKNFDLMVFAQGQGGNKIFKNFRRTDVGKANFTADAMSRWSGEGTSNNYPRLTEDDPNQNFKRMSSFYLEDGDFVRIKLVQLGFTLPESVFKDSFKGKVRIYSSVENLYTFTKYTGFDPEIGGNVFGVDKGMYPQARTFILGMNVQF